MTDGMETDEDDRKVLAQFKTDTGELTGPAFEIPINITKDKLKLVCNAFLEKVDNTPYDFFVSEVPISATLGEALGSVPTPDGAPNQEVGSEEVVEIVYQPLAVFKVKAVTRCSSTIEGHAEAVLSTAFSPNGQYLASGSGDTTVRFWDLQTETPQFTCKGHTNHVLWICWSPNGKKLASACKNGKICIWDPSTGKQMGKTMTGHTKFITCMSWKPLHLDPRCVFLASASKDATIRIWDTVLGRQALCLSAHAQSVMGLRWGGTDLIYSASQDRTIKVWRASDGTMCRSLEGHAHWVSILALNTDYVMRIGLWDPAPQGRNKPTPQTDEEIQKFALEKYNEVKGDAPERLVSGSDDFTLMLWEPEIGKKPVQRMTGHSQLINDVKFSPDARLVASASFDKSVKIWDGRTGKYITSLRGHVSRVYIVSWSADSRLVCSGSSDSTLKLWNIPNKKLLNDLPGHADEVYAVDWSPDGQRVVSGGKDKVLKIWRY